MSRTCFFCGKGVKFGGHRRHKYGGGWEYRAPRTSRKFKANLRKVKIEKGYLDPFMKTNIMSANWINENGDKMFVKQLFNENQLLLNLKKQPTEIRQLLFDTIDYAEDHAGKYDYFKFLEFLGNHRLDRIADSLDTFTPMLSS